MGVAGGRQPRRHRGRPPSRPSPRPMPARPQRACARGQAHQSPGCAILARTSAASTPPWSMASCARSIRMPRRKVLQRHLPEGARRDQHLRPVPPEKAAQAHQSEEGAQRGSEMVRDPVGSPFPPSRRGWPIRPKSAQAIWQHGQGKLPDQEQFCEAGPGLRHAQQDPPHDRLRSGAPRRRQVDLAGAGILHPTSSIRSCSLNFGANYHMRADRPRLASSTGRRCRAPTRFEDRRRRAATVPARPRKPTNGCQCGPKGCRVILAMARSDRRRHDRRTVLVEFATPHLVDAAGVVVKVTRDGTPLVWDAATSSARALLLAGVKLRSKLPIPWTANPRAAFQVLGPTA